MFDCETELIEKEGDNIVFTEKKTFDFLYDFSLESKDYYPQKNEMKLEYLEQDSLTFFQKYERSEQYKELIK